jgi:hypothetical protein
MSVFPDWQKFAVPQRRQATGCIPTGYEMILKAAGAMGIDFAKFQDEFDLDKDLMPSQAPRNNFKSVAAAVTARYPAVVFQVREFGPGLGSNKLRFVEEQVTKKRPLLISLAQAPFNGMGWHIMPVVDMDETSLILLRVIRPDGSRELQRLLKSELVRIHNEYPGGNDVAFLERC